MLGHPAPRGWRLHVWSGSARTGPLRQSEKGTPLSCHQRRQAQGQWLLELLQQRQSHPLWSPRGARVGQALTFSDAVAILVPCRLRAMQLRTPSWAGMSTGGFSVLARSTSCTWPVCAPGKAKRELLLFGHRTQRPKQRQRKPVEDSGQSSKPLPSRRQSLVQTRALSASSRGINGRNYLWVSPSTGIPERVSEGQAQLPLMAPCCNWKDFLNSHFAKCLSSVVPGLESAEL